MFVEVEPRAKSGKSSAEKISTGRETLRLRSKGPATMEDMVGYVYLIPILLGNVWMFMFIELEIKVKPRS